MGLGSSFAVGLLAGLRSMSAPALASRITHTGGALSGPSRGFIRRGNAPLVLALIAAGELFADKLPLMPSRKKAPSFAWRVASGALSAGAMSESRGDLPLSLLAGGLGAAAGTLGGSALRSKLADAFGHDLPAALVEDALVIGIAALVVWSASESADITPMAA
jgi:uncharacterized membrane protein